MCSRHRPEAGADSGWPEIDSRSGWPEVNPDTYEETGDWVKDPTPMGISTPVWPTRAMLEGWDSYPIPSSARALVGAGARGGE